MRANCGFRLRSLIATVVRCSNALRASLLSRVYLARVDKITLTFLENYVRSECVIDLCCAIFILLF